MHKYLLLIGLGCWLLAGQVLAQQGLKGEYYTGINFERKVFTRIDPKISFAWEEKSPGHGMPYSYYSIRWTGKLLAPATGQYRFSARVDDGIRLWVGNKKVMDSWQLNDSKSFVGSVTLEAGHYYDFRVDYFNDMMGGEIELFWQLPDSKRLFLDRFIDPGDPITAKYFSQKPLPVSVPHKPVPPAPVAVVTPPKTIPPKRPISVVPKLLPKSPPAKKTVLATPAPVAPPTIRQPAESAVMFAAGTTVVLPKVQFEQSSYTLLPESSAELDQLVTALKKNPGWRIKVAGHTDNIGDQRLNLALSENRAKVVAHYLIRAGIADNRITTVGYGGLHPIADNAIEHERSKNRRVEIVID